MKYGSVFSCEDEEQRNNKRIVPYRTEAKAHLGYLLRTHDGQPYVQVQLWLLTVQEDQRLHGIHRIGEKCCGNGQMCPT